MALSTPAALYYLSLCLEGIFFGLYSGIFTIHLHCCAAEKARRNITFYALCVLYVLSAAVIAFDVLMFVNAMFNHGADIINLGYCFTIVTQPIVFTCYDFIGQCIQIYRCWIVWGRNIPVVIIPSVLALAYLVMWIISIASIFPISITSELQVYQKFWNGALIVPGFTASMIVNALVTGLIVFKIFTVFREGKENTNSSGAKSSSIQTGGGKLRSIIFIIIESEMVLFAVQLTRLMISLTWKDSHLDIEDGVYAIIVCSHQMLNGITPTIILVRVSMGLSFSDEPSFKEAVSSLRFASDDSDRSPIPAMENISQERVDDDTVDIDGTR